LKYISIFVSTAGCTLQVSVTDCASDDIISPWGYLTLNPKLRLDSKFNLW
jgi:hypothetical protein